MQKGVATVAQLEDFDEIIDVRTPAEFAEDHVPGAINLPVLDNEQRIIVGTIYKQQSAFEARRVGGAMVAENIARHVAGPLRDKPKNWRPLVYCWRGGQRSGSFVTWLRMIGWDAHQLSGGYKRFRHLVIEHIETLAPQLQLRMICGATGSGKTRILEALARHGAQVLDLEDMAAHKGSVLGALPDREQPTQKGFETALDDRMRRLDTTRPVFVEAESRKIGRLHLPDPLITAMRAAPCLRVEASRDARLEFLVRDYAYLGENIPALRKNIERLRSLQSNETLERWHQLAVAGDMPTLFGELIDLHYDPLYKRSQGGNFPGLATAPCFETDDLSPPGIDRIAQQILASLDQGSVIAASVPRTAQMR
ncbi:tRNA 2-selenouridine(34) synthase MnmH [Azoarcus sp. L1K30]|uniref:tRNA 2-selenouridine(34) synthase MnmH n=1 Tax=Azoarcus sp. L1K30 TaxID=2820277 RepID=UPI001B82D870|nr:tRNA 2-selenouridine(34) synthase MnmH [Azoarcus sp. L1K30]MBR0565682.1 tRNA 2-selenouridine(34) synthase MnmH [Azoarcus sp. L1K30]